MITVSNDFKNSISKTEREMKGYVEVLYTSKSPKSSFTIGTVPEILSIGGTDIDENAIIDDDRKGRNYASLEQDYFKLDGTFVLPNNVANKNPGIGYVSKYTYEEEQEEITDINPFRIYANAECDGITIYFQNNKPLDLSIIVGTANGQETFDNPKITESGVASIRFTTRVVTYIFIFVNDVLYPNRRLRIQEIDFGLSAIYEGEDLISFKTTEEIDRFNDKMPINEIDVVIGDFESNFDPENNNGITSYLNSDVLIKPYVGVLTENNGIEYCLKGTYWLDSYETNSKQATLKGKDIFNKLQDKDYNKYYIIENSRKMPSSASVSDYINFKEDKWGITINDYHLSDYEINNRVSDIFSKIDTKSNNLQKLGIVVGGTFNADRYGNIWYKSLYNENTSNSTYKNIDFTNMKEYPKITAKTPLKSITVNETIIHNVSVPSTLETIYENTFTSGNEIEELYIDLDGWITANYPQLSYCNELTSSWSVDPTQPEGSQGHYGSIDDSYLYLKLKKVAGTPQVIIKGYKNETSETSNIKQLEETGQDLTISDDFIASSGSTDIRNVSNAIINFNTYNRAKNMASFSYSGDPSIECGDCIYIQNKYADNYNKLIITKITSEYKGSYNESIEGDIIEN